MKKKIKLKKCKVCKAEFKPTHSTTQTVCGYQCAAKHARKQEEKKAAQIALNERKQTKADKEALKTIQTLANEAQTAFNGFIRERDKGLQCCSCYKPDVGPRNASHYYNANNHWELRYDENNVHASCVECNKPKHGNLIEYRKRLVFRFGEDYVKDLDDRCNLTANYSREDLINIKLEYRMKTKELKKSK